MIRSRSTLLAASLTIVAVATIAAAADRDTEARSITPATVVMQLPDARGAMERPRVEFNHSAHTTALKQEGCEVCHAIDDGKITPKLAATVNLTDRDDLIDAFHDTCTGCHQERAAAARESGPVTCGECHVRLDPGVSGRSPMAFDYSLHGRHANAYEDKCENCHHVYDEVLRELKYEKGAEEGCRSCHGAVDEEKKLSLRNASHRDCVSCHLARSKQGLEGGPVLCVGCHDAENQREIRRLEEIPRLLRGQPDTVWIAADEARSAVVAFNHEAHETFTTTCSTCHHQTLKRCEECHTLSGSEEGLGITMAQAYHLSSSQHSCVGCHSVETASKDCAGCHHSLGHPSGERACTVCHSGPPAGSLSGDSPPPTFDELRLAALPPTSDDFPETVVINGLIDSYQESKLPHARIVGKLHEIVGDSTLAGRFHGDTDTLCNGCHHHSPAGTRPPPCRACHGTEAEATNDKPGLKVAYHRQCIGCHIEMGIPQQGCTDCHAATEEVES
jgi:hypothetical protein